MAIAYVGSIAGSTASAATLTISYTSTAGNLLIIGVQHPAGDVSGITDSAGNTWKIASDSSAANPTVKGTSAATSLWYCGNATAVSSVTITVTASGVICGTVMEVSGADNVQPMGNFAQTFTGGSTTMTTGTITAPGTISVLFVGVGGYTATTAGTRLDTVGGGVTAVAQTNNGTTTESMGYALNPSSGPILWTLSTSKANAAVGAVFKPALAAQSTLGPALEFIPPDGGVSGWATQTTTPTTWSATTAAESNVRVIVKPAKGQLWPRSNKDNGTSP